MGGDWEIRQQVDGTVVTDLCGDGATTICTVTPLTEVGRWYHVAFTFDSSNDTYAIYVDGQLEASGTNPVNMVQQAGRGSLVRHAHGRDRVLERRPSRCARLQPQVVPSGNSKTCTASCCIGSWTKRAATPRPIRRAWATTDTVTGTASWTAGKINNAIQLNGTNHVEVSSLLGSPKNVTIAAWGNLTAADTSGAELVSIGDYFTIRLNEGTTTRAYFYNGSSSVATSVSQTLHRLASLRRRV